MNWNSLGMLGVTSPIGRGRREARATVAEIRSQCFSMNNKDGGNWMMGFARLVFAGLLAIAATGLAQADDVHKAKVGVLRLSSSAPVFIAQDKGYFRDAGLDIRLRFFDAA